MAFTVNIFVSFWVFEVYGVINNYSSATHKLLVTMPQNEKGEIYLQEGDPLFSSETKIKQM